MENQTVTGRYSGISLYKALAMYMVVMLHVLGQGGILGSTRAYSVNFWVAWFLEMGAYCAVNCFAIATGFLMGEKKIKYRKIVPLWLMVLFYNTAFMVFGGKLFPDYNFREYLGFALPVTYSEYWYFTAYVGLFFLMPFLNVLVENLTVGQYKKMLGVGFVLICIPAVLGNKPDLLRTTSGYSIWWLMYLYLLGAGIKKHRFFCKISAVWGLSGYVGMVALTWLTKFGLHQLFINSPGALVDNIKQVYGDGRFVSYISPTMVFAAVFLLIFCMKLPYAPRVAGFLNWMSPMVFSVYIIHVNHVLWYFFMKNRFAHAASLPAAQMVISCVGYACAIFFSCIAVDWLRIQLFKLLRIDRVVNLLADKVNALLRKGISV